MNGCSWQLAYPPLPGWPAVRAGGLIPARILRSVLRKASNNGSCAAIKVPGSPPRAALRACCMPACGKLGRQKCGSSCSDRSPSLPACPPARL